MRTAKNPVYPGLPTFLPPGNLGAAAIKSELHNLSVSVRRRKGRGKAPLDSKPIVEEISHCSFQSDGVGVEQRRPKAHPRSSQAQLPAVVIASAVNKLR